MRSVGLALGAICAVLLGLAGCGAGSGRSGTDLAVVGSGPTQPLNGGDPVSFTMTVSNRGEFPARDLTIRNVLLQLSQSALAITCAAQGGAICPATTGATMTVDSLPAGGSLVFEVTTTVNLGASGTIGNTMSVASATTTDVDSSNNTATVSTSAASNDVSISGTTPPGPLLEGDAVFTMLVSNAGPDTARDVRLTTTASASVQFDAAAIACTPSIGATAPTYQADGSWLAAEIAAGASLSCAVPVTVAIGTNGTAAVSMTAAAAGDARTANNTGTASVSATRVFDLAVSGSAAVPNMTGGGTSSFTMRVLNNGPAAAEDVSLTNTLSTDLALGGAIACTASGGAAAPLPTGDGTLVSALIPVGGELACVVPVVVAAGANGVVFDTFTASATGERTPGSNTATATAQAVSSNLGVSQTGEVQVNAGNGVEFSARVSNPGPGTASNLRIQWSATAPAGVAFETPTCTPLSGATCPALLGPDMTVPSLPPGRTLVFGFRASTEAAARGAVVSTVVVGADEDQDLSNNAATSTTTVVDARSGSYKVYAADGRLYDMAIDFDAASYTMSGNGSSVQRSFTAVGGGFTVAGNARFRVGSELIAGGHDFGAGVLPFVAARAFTTNLAAIGGTYILASRLIDGAGVARTLPGTMFISGNTLSTCESESAPVATVRLCATGSRRDFVGLTPSGNGFVGTAADGESFEFAVANVGAARLVVSVAPAADGSRRLRLAVIDSSAGISFGPPQQGATTAGDWVTTTLADGLPVQYAATGTIGSDSAALVAVTNSGAGPFSMLTGTSTAANGSIYLLQSFPVQIVIGGPVAFSPASGLLQITLP